jgi:hypothetical protein
MFAYDCFLQDNKVKIGKKNMLVSEEMFIHDGLFCEIKSQI